MKLKLLAIPLFIAVLCFTSCGNDDEECLVLEDTIVGTWENATLGSGDFEFKSDGTLVDENDLLIGGEINGVVLDTKTYTVSGDTLVSLRASNDPQFITVDLPVSDFECDAVTFDVFGIGITVTRK